MKNYAWIAAALAALCVTAPEAQAQLPLGGYSSSFGFGCGNRAGLYNLGQLSVPPYFAIHPPVYYGQRVHRTYGRSPYARPSFGIGAPAAPQPAPQMVANPYVADQQQALRQQAGGTRPQLVLNPYVEQPEGLQALARSRGQMVLNPHVQPRVAQK